MKVFKFGGASVRDAEAVRNVAAVLKLYAGEEIVVVVSAMGKMTNALEEIAYSYVNKKEDTKKLLQGIKRYHLEILEELFSDKSRPIFEQVNNAFVEIEWILEDEPIKGYDFEYDQIVSVGELISTKIVSALLTETGINNKWVDVRDFLKTDNTYREAKVDWELTEKKIKELLLPKLSSQESGGVVVTQGFVGVTSENYNTTLGREGSDYTAAIIGSLLDAEEVIIWKDVPGVLSADPKWFDNTEKLDALSYHDAIELAFFGATVIHPKTIKPLQNKQILLKVKSFYEPKEAGTIITATKEVSEDQQKIPSFIFKVDQVLISIIPRDYSFIIEENLSEIFKKFANYQVKVNLMQHAALSFSVCVDGEVNRVPNLIEELQKDFKVLYNENVELVTVRNYDQKTIDQVTKGKKIFVEQKSRQTARFVVKNNG
ncbi:MAG: aspartate kinase [Bacteroidetes bacterium]|nr:MAG: aspartate kinase [Bacteroidota bacterium]